MVMMAVAELPVLGVSGLAVSALLAGFLIGRGRTNALNETLEAHRSRIDLLEKELKEALAERSELRGSNDQLSKAVSEMRGLLMGEVVQPALRNAIEQAAQENRRHHDESLRALEDNFGILVGQMIERIDALPTALAAAIVKEMANGR